MSAEQQAPAAGVQTGSGSGPGALGAALVAVLVLIALADAAIETFWSGSPLRWWIALATLAFVASSLWVWRPGGGPVRRFGPGAAAATSCGGLLALLAITAWLPGGQVDGVKLFLLPTGRILTAVVALAVAGAAIRVLGSFRSLASPARMVVGGGFLLLAAYALASLGIGFYEGASPTAVLGGGAIWQRLPRYLQGSWIGAFVIVPAGVLASIVAFARHRSRHVAHLGSGMLLAAAFVISLAGVFAHRGPATGSLTPALLAPGLGVPAPVGEPGAAPAAVIERGELGRILKAYQEIPGAADRTSFDVTARAAALGPDPVAAFSFVRDGIANEIYPGVLRGAAGTLSARAGNDLDKAVLLAALLRHGKQQVRYAHCPLSPSLADVRTRTAFGPTGKPRFEESDITQPLRAALVRNGISPKRSEELVAIRKRSRAWLDDAVQRTSAGDLAIVRDALGRADIRPQLQPGAVVPRDAGGHYWLQMEATEGWMDFDASIPEAKPGQTFCSADETYAEIPDGLYQTITVSVRNEYLSGSTLSSRVVLQHQVRVSDQYGKILFVDNLGETTPGQQTLPKTLIPTLRLDTDTIVGSEYSPTGEASAPALGGADMFGALMGGESPSAPAPLVAQWIDLVFEAPGRKVEESRAVTDLVDARQRASGTISMKPDQAVVVASLAQTCALAISAGPIQPAEAFERIYGNVDPDAAGRAFDAADPANPDEALDKDLAEASDATLASYAVSYALAAERALAQLSSSAGPHLRLTRDQPMVTIANFSIRPRPTDSGLRGSLSLDVRHNMVGVTSDSGDYAEAAFWANAQHGLVDGALEHHLAGAALRSAGRQAGAATGIDTTGLLATARERGIEIRAETGPRAMELLRGELAPAGGHRLIAEIRGATAAILPTRPVPVGDDQRLGLWTTDLRTGHVTALVDTGLRHGGLGRESGEGGGQPAAERAKMEERMHTLNLRVRHCVMNPATRRSDCWEIYLQWRRVANAYLRAINSGKWINVPGPQIFP
jgi:hypothetical protein